MVKFSEDERAALWEMFEAGVPYKKIGRTLGRGHSSVRKHIMYAGGKRPVIQQPSELRLSLAEREEISRGLAAGWSLRQIAASFANTFRRRPIFRSTTSANSTPLPAPSTPVLARRWAI